ncbi:MAG: type II toxin-antitoxin system VapC family toxin [Caulobacteraceae bacterium]
MSIYIDASVLVSMWVSDSHSRRVDRWIETVDSSLVVSDWGAAEFSSALGARHRSGALSEPDREAAERSFDAWFGSGVTQTDILAEDFRSARRLIRMEIAPLKAPDALHLAVARRLGAVFATLDRPLSRAADRLGVSTIGFEAFD